MATRLPIATRNAMLASISARLDGGTGAGTVQVRSGSQPATGDTAASGTLLATLTLSDPSFGAPSNGAMSANAVAGDSSADATGAAGWYRALDSTGATVIDGSVTATGGGGDMTFDNVSFVQGGAINMTSWTINQPGL